MLTFRTVTSAGTDSCTGAKLRMALIPARTTCFTTAGVFSAGVATTAMSKSCFAASFSRSDIDLTVRFSQRFPILASSLS